LKFPVLPKSAWYWLP